MTADATDAIKNNVTMIGNFIGLDQNEPQNDMRVV